MTPAKPHGGARKGAGRKTKRTAPLESVSITLEPEHRKWADRLGRGNLSAGVRILIDLGILNVASMMPGTDPPEPSP